MKKPRICAVIVDNNLETLREVEPLVELFEVRIDLIGERWQDLASQLRKPWIATNRSADEGGRWQGNEARRVEQLLQAVELGANIVDIELATKNLENILKLIKRRTKCLISSHNLEKTPPL
ncbi:MAG: type I 3-dehydroquinate dehydratase, partial [Chloroflexota bacterium]